MKQSNKLFHLQSFVKMEEGQVSVHIFAHMFTVCIMWMFFKLMSEKHDFSFFNNYSLFREWFYMKNVK